MAATRISQVLMTEHRGIERMLDVVDRAAAQVERGNPVPADLFVDAGRFFSSFADHCHHTKEEKHLFPALQARGVPVEGGPIGVMLAEHDQGRAYVRLIREEGRRYAEGTLQDPKLLVDAVRGYVSLLRQHIQKEDHILFALSDRLLSPSDQQALLEACERVEREEMGEGEHERFHAMIDELEREMHVPSPQEL
jgi:hemerythrin-like domain-containing protein